LFRAPVRISKAISVADSGANESDRTIRVHPVDRSEVAAKSSISGMLFRDYANLVHSTFKLGSYAS